MHAKSCRSQRREQQSLLGVREASSVKATFGTDSGVWEFLRGDFESNLQILKPETDMEIRESEINHLLYCR